MAELDAGRGVPAVNVGGVGANVVAEKNRSMIAGP
jgi:hypothetical protein